MFGAFTEFHSSGTVRDLHPIPFSPFFHAREGEHQTCGKDNASFRETARKRGLFSPTAARKRRKGHPIPVCASTRKNIPNITLMYQIRIQSFLHIYFPFCSCRIFVNFAAIIFSH
jgi:hypothetical protein